MGIKIGINYRCWEVMLHWAAALVRLVLENCSHAMGFKELGVFLGPSILVYQAVPWPFLQS